MECDEFVAVLREPPIVAGVHAAEMLRELQIGRGEEEQHGVQSIAKRAQLAQIGETREVTAGLEVLGQKGHQLAE